METSDSARDRIIEAAAAVIGETGLTETTVAKVARRAGVSTALVHYHFATKAHLTVAAAGWIADARSSALRRSLGRGTGLTALDALWSDVTARVQRGTERAWLELSAAVRADPDLAAVIERGRRSEREAWTARVPTLLRELGVEPATGAEELAGLLSAMLDGLAVALVSGEPAGAVRAAYDALWLILVAAGQAARRR